MSSDAGDPDGRDGFTAEGMEALMEALDDLPEPMSWEDAAKALLELKDE